MRVAISTDGGEVSGHFGRCPSFTIVDLVDGKVIKRDIIDNPGHQPGLIPEFLKGQGVEYIIAGGMGMRAQQFFGEMEIKTIMGITGSVDDVIEKLIAGTLAGGESLYKPGDGKGYGLDKEECDHPEE